MSGWSHVCYSDELPDTGGACCIGEAMGGPSRCTCWEPMVPPHAEPLPPVDLVVRVERCADCAFRPDSPERADGTVDRILKHQIPAQPDRPFFCHQGLTPVTEYRHPSGVTYDPRDLPSNQGRPPMDYQPAYNTAGRPCKDDGTQQDVCAGWAAERDRIIRRTA